MIENSFIERGKKPSVEKVQDETKIIFREVGRYSVLNTKRRANYIHSALSLVTLRAQNLSRLNSSA